MLVDLKLIRVTNNWLSTRVPLVDEYVIMGTLYDTYVIMGTLVDVCINKRYPIRPGYRITSVSNLHILFKYKV